MTELEKGYISSLQDDMIKLRDTGTEAFAIRKVSEAVLYLLNKLPTATGDVTTDECTHHWSHTSMYLGNFYCTLCGKSLSMDSAVVLLNRAEQIKHNGWRGPKVEK